MTVIPIKPISVNELYRNVPGRGRVKTQKYKQFIEDRAWLLLPKLPELHSEKLSIAIVCAVSNKQQDLDNCAKAILDAIQNRYHINDNSVYSLTMLKRVVPKGSEYVEITIKPHGENNE